MECEPRSNTLLTTGMSLGVLIALYYLLYITGLEDLVSVFVFVLFVGIIAFFIWRVRSIKIKQMESNRNGEYVSDLINKSVWKSKSQFINESKKPLVLPRVNNLRKSELADSWKYIT